MVKRSENLPLLAKASQDKIRVHASLDKFDRYSLFEFIVGPHGFIDRTHSATSNFTFDAIGSKTTPNHRVVIISGQQLQLIHYGGAVERIFEEVGGVFVLGEQRLDVVFQSSVIGACLRH